MSHLNGRVSFSNYILFYYHLYSAIESGTCRFESVACDCLLMKEWVWRQDKTEFRLRGLLWDWNNHQKCHVYKKHTKGYGSPVPPTLPHQSIYNPLQWSFYPREYIFSFLLEMNRVKNEIFHFCITGFLKARNYCQPQSITDYRSWLVLVFLSLWIHIETASFSFFKSSQQKGLFCLLTKKSGNNDIWT